MIVLLCFRGVHLDSVSGEALFETADSKNAEMIDILQQAGVCIDRTTGHCTSFLCYAVSRDSTAAFETLLKCGADTRQICYAHGSMTCGQQPLALAVINGQLEITKLLLMHGTDVTAQARWKESLLETAALSGHTEIVRLLLHHGADDDRFYDLRDSQMKRDFYSILWSDMVI